MRLDKFIQQNFNLKSRAYAENLIKTGRVFVNGKQIVKPALDVDDVCDIQILSDENYASQGAYKLEEALKAFGIDVNGKVALDLGCSNGGFTDCLLRHGVGSVIAVDVGECCLPDDILNCGKVKFVKANARNLPPEICDIDFVCGDLSFISLKYIFPEIGKVLKNGGEGVMLIKPQFELDKSALSKKGIVLDEKLRQKTVQNVVGYAAAAGLNPLGTTLSPIRFSNKNIEYLLHFKKCLTI